MGFLEHMSLLDTVRDRGCHIHVAQSNLTNGLGGALQDVTLMKVCKAGVSYAAMWQGSQP